MTRHSYTTYNDALKLFNTEYRKENGVQLSTTLRAFLRASGRIDVCHEGENTMASISPDNIVTITLPNYTPEHGYTPYAHTQPWDLFGITHMRVGKGRYHVLHNRDPRGVEYATGPSGHKPSERAALEKCGPVYTLWGPNRDRLIMSWSSITKWGYELMDGLKFNIETGVCINPRRVVQTISPEAKARLRRDVTKANRTWRVLVRVDPTTPDKYPPDVPYASTGLPQLLSILRGAPMTPSTVRGIKSAMYVWYPYGQTTADFSNCFIRYVRQYRDRLQREYGMTYIVEPVEEAHGGVPT